MARKTITQWNGGISNNSKSGPLNSWRFAKHLNIYSDDDSVSLNPIPVKSSGTTVTDLIKWFVTTVPFTDVDKWAVGDVGNLYRTDGTLFWNLERSGATIGNGAAGQGLIVFEDNLYYATSTTIGRGGILSTGTGSMVYDDNFIQTLGLDLDQEQTGSGQTYTTPTSITENAVNSFFFTPLHDPIRVFEIIFGTKGTGNVTLTVHDSNNNVVTSKTVNNGDLPASGVFDFAPDTPWRPILGQEYHFHLTSTVADATVQTGTNADLSTVNVDIFFGVLLANSQFHPMIQHTNGVTGTIVIGNNDYFAVWDGTTYNPNQIRIEPGYRIRGWTRENEYIVAYAWKGTDVNEVEEGKLFYWDGIQPYYNFSKPVTGGVPNALVNYKNRILGTLGNNSILTLGTEPFKTIQPVPLITRTKTIQVYPGAITTWENRAHIGIGVESTDSTGLYQGVYEFGNNSDRAVSFTSVSTEVLNFGYTISTGDNQGTTMKIGAVAGFGDTMYIGWKSQAGTYGIDLVTPTNDPASTGSWESLIDDDSVDGKGNIYAAPQKMKEAHRLCIFYETLPVGCTITPKYKLDRATSWTLGTGTDIGIAGSQFCLMDINQRYYEIEYGYDITATVNYPKILGLYYDFEGLDTERDTGI